MIAHTLFDTPVGPLSGRADERGLLELAFARGQRPAEPSRGHTTGNEHGLEVLAAVQRQVAEYFAGRRRAFDVPIALKGPQFHRTVWAQLLEIPYGQTISYGELARRIGDPEAARAVGSANGANPVVIIVPCHRVIGADGRLVGYGGGLKRKRLLLDLEAGRLSLLSA